MKAKSISWCNNVKTLLLSSLVVSSLVFYQSSFAGGKNKGKEWQFHGVDITNNADASKLTKINKKNVDKLELFAIYNIPQATNPPGQTRAENAVGSGVAVDKKGIIYLPVTDGRMIVIDSNQLDGINPDGTNKPLVVRIDDFVLDSEYTGASASDGDDIQVNRLQPSMANDTLFAGNYGFFLGTPEQMGVPIPALGYTPLSQGAVLMAIDKDTGDLKWKTVVEDNPFSIITNNPVVYKGVVYVSMSSQMSGTLGVPSLGPTFPLFDYNQGFDPFLSPTDPVSKSGVMYRNSLVALDVETGEMIWKTYVIPEQIYRDQPTVVAEDNLGIWTGASSWGGGNFAIDKKRKQIYIGTGQVYGAPQAALDCEVARLSVPGADPFGGEACYDFNQDGSPIVGPITNIPSGTPGVSSSSHVLADALIAFDLETGQIKWAKRFNGLDVWNLSCIANIFGPPFGNETPLCPAYLRAGSPFFGLNFFAKDLDLGEQPMLVKGVKVDKKSKKGKKSKKDLLIVTSKRADVNAVDADTGELVWGPTSFGPGSLFGGGILWGSATDGERAYIASTTGALTTANVNDPELKVVPGSCPPEAFNPDGSLAGGIYGAINLKDGSIAWQRCLIGTVIDPNTGLPILDGSGNPEQNGAWYEGPVTVANGVVYVGISRAYQEIGNILSEFVALDAKTGELLKRMPLNAPGEPSAFTPRYQRVTVIGDMVILTNGFKDEFTSPLARRLVIYKLPSKQDGGDDDDSDSDSDSDSSSDD